MTSDERTTLDLRYRDVVIDAAESMAGIANNEDERGLLFMNLLAQAAIISLAGLYSCVKSDVIEGRVALVLSEARKLAALVGPGEGASRTLN